MAFLLALSHVSLRYAPHALLRWRRLFALSQVLEGSQDQFEYAETFFNLLQVAVTEVAIIISFSSLRVATITGYKLPSKRPTSLLRSRLISASGHVFILRFTRRDFKLALVSSIGLGFTQGITGFRSLIPTLWRVPGDVRSLSVRAGKRRGVVILWNREHNRHRLAAVARAV